MRGKRLPMSPGLIAVGVAGAALLLVTLADIFAAIFNYDGFTFPPAPRVAIGPSAREPCSRHAPRSALLAVISERAWSAEDSGCLGTLGCAQTSTIFHRPALTSYFLLLSR